MNSREAKEILLLYRPGIDGDEDADVTEALALAERDAELGNWFQEHCAFQQALRTKFKEISIPEGLKEQILSERKSHFAPPSRRKLAFAVCSVLVCISAAIAYSILHPHSERTIANFQIRMLKTVPPRDFPPMDLETSDLARIGLFLAARQAPSDYVLPEGLQKTTATGCAILEWQGKPVSMVCFHSGRNPNADQPDLFLFIINRAEITDAPHLTNPQFVQRGNKFTTATWSKNAKTYLLAGVGDEAFLREFSF